MCYMEAQKNITTINEMPTTEGGEMCINTEWGAFGATSGALDGVKTQFDQDVDNDSPNRGQQM